MYSTATATNRMMNATTDATKLNFMTDQGSTRASVSIAWRLVDLRVWMPLAGFFVEPRFCQADVTELARPVAAPLTAEAAEDAAEEAADAADAAPDENPLLDDE